MSKKRVLKLFYKLNIIDIVNFKRKKKFSLDCVVNI